MAPQSSRQPALNWRKSSASGASGGCVEAASIESFVLVRDSHNRPGAVLCFTPAQWLEFLRSIRNGQHSSSL
jgi:Domain of unknown function (DUF397)